MRAAALADCEGPHGELCPLEPSGEGAEYARKARKTRRQPISV